MTNTIAELLAERKRLDAKLKRAVAKAFPVGSRWEYMTGDGPVEVVVVRQHANDPECVVVTAAGWKCPVSMSRLTPASASPAS